MYVINIAIFILVAMFQQNKYVRFYFLETPGHCFSWLIEIVVCFKMLLEVNLVIGLHKYKQENNKI